MSSPESCALSISLSQHDTLQHPENLHFHSAPLSSTVTATPDPSFAPFLPSNLDVARGEFSTLRTPFLSANAPDHDFSSSPQRAFRSQSPSVYNHGIALSTESSTENGWLTCAPAQSAMMGSSLWDVLRTQSLEIESLKTELQREKAKRVQESQVVAHAPGPLHLGIPSPSFSSFVDSHGSSPSVFECRLTSYESPTPYDSISHVATASSSSFSSFADSNVSSVLEPRTTIYGSPTADETAYGSPAIFDPCTPASSSHHGSTFEASYTPWASTQVQDHSKDTDYIILQNSRTGMTTGSQSSSLPFVRDSNHKAFVSPPALTAMASRRRRIDSKLFHCDLCSATFTAKHNLKNHKNSHYGVRNYQCAGCGRLFGTSHVLKRHSKTCKSAQSPS